MVWNNKLFAYFDSIEILIIAYFDSIEILNPNSLLANCLSL